MKIFRAVMMVLVAFIGIIVAISPQIAQAQVLPATGYAHHYIIPDHHQSASNPVTRYYKVKNGDSLSDIASGHKTTWQSLYCDNKRLIGNDPNLIKPGERLILPDKKIICHIALPSIKQSTQTSTYTSPVPSNPPTAPVVSSPPQASLTQLQSYALALLNGDTAQYSCLNSVINIESGWNVYATNPSSGAYGIPQALPGSKMSVAGSDWATDGETQLRWMIDDYIPSSYGTPCGALAHEESYGWY